MVWFNVIFFLMNLKCKNFLRNLLMLYIFQAKFVHDSATYFTYFYHFLAKISCKNGSMLSTFSPKNRLRLTNWVEKYIYIL